MSWYEFIQKSCVDDWKLNQKKIITTRGSCVAKCQYVNRYKYEYNGKCYENCPNGYLTDDNNNIINEWM